MRINTPHQVTIGSGGTSARFVWSNQLTEDWQAAFSDAQKFIDSEVLRLSVPFLPHQSGALQRSGVMGTTIGSGEVVYNSPYASFLYYGKLMVGTQSGSAWAHLGEPKKVVNKNLKFHSGGPFWFDRMKVTKGDQILRGAAAVMQRGTE